ncbi:tubulin glycylase 3A-like isoform X2 [Arctopsyche grandis]|uniref:tubulin glycylase 3A-like isoform X2 n=1 Tax=Arctopsyche grandis TaxID=121162 RepID=UPI00406D9DC8
MDVDVVKIHMAITSAMQDDKNEPAKENVQKRNGRPHSAHSFSTRKLSPETNPSEGPKQYKPWVSSERWKELRKMAETAGKEKKVFLIKGGGFPAIRHALLERGWVEKIDSSKPRIHQMYNLSSELSTNDTTSKSLSESEKLLKLKCEKAILNKFLDHQPVDFLWTTKRDKYDWMLVKKDVMISRFCRSSFTSKEGLCAALNQTYWYNEPGVASTMFPRCYILHNQDQLDEFVDDFRLTACLGLLKWLTNTFSKGGPESVASIEGKVPCTAVEFALNRVSEYLTFVYHNDIDEVEDRTKHIWEHEWDQFLTHHYLLIHENAKFLDENSMCFIATERRASKLLLAIAKYWPQMDLDGIMNIWIVKPGNKCRGRGIQLMNNLKDIVGIVNFPLAAKTRYVVQKYIENPLIIYNTKFDIRQWFLITSSQPLTIWMYKDSYLRFSSQLFNLTNYHESVHLTNNAIQSKYKNHNQRDKALPDENMWDCHTFKTYLRQIGKSGIWEDKIYPGMRECLIGTMLACQDTMDRRLNSFELYGADFMLTEDFTPWLIEINSSPDLAPTTSVTARLCPQCLEDITKVVIDRKSNPDANTGMFELIYKQVVPRAPAYLGLSLSVSGKKIFKKIKVEKPKTEREPTPVVPKQKQEEESRVNTRPNSGYNSSVIPELMSWLQPYNADTNQNTTKEFERKPTPTVQHALTVVKSGLLLKASTKKRKSSSNTSLRKHSAKKDRNQNIKTKNPTAANYCFRNDNELKIANSKDPKKGNKVPSKNIEKIYWHDPNIIKSVGNKRCYIEPAAWERDTASILRSCSSSVLQSGIKSDGKQTLQVTPRVFSPGIMAFHKMLRKGPNDTLETDPTKSFSTVSLNIKRVKHCKRDNKKLQDIEIKLNKSGSCYKQYKTEVTLDSNNN